MPNDSAKNDRRDSNMEEDSLRLVQRLKAGDASAEQEFVNRYMHRLIALARKQLSPKLNARLDPEDVAQSALGSFCMRLRDGRIDFSSNRVWSLLAKITLNKAKSRAAHHTAGIRNVDAEEQYSSSDGLLTLRYASITSGPSPSEIADLKEELENLLAHFDSTERKIIELRIQNYSILEIKDQVCRSAHSVRRVLVKVEDRLIASAKKYADEQ